MAHVSVITGTRHSDRERRIDDLVAAGWDHALLIVPTRDYARQRLEQLILGRDMAGSWGRRILTFHDFVDRFLAAAGIRADLLDEAEQHLLVEQAIGTVGLDGTVRSLLGESLHSSGFADHVLRIIRNLKEEAVEPEAFEAAAAARAAKGQAGDLDAVVVKAYEAYQAALQSTTRYDREGTYWVAESYVREKGLPPALRGLRLIALDGFDDFTQAQFRLMSALADRIDTVAFGLVCNLQDATFQDLFEIPIQTLDRLRDTFGPQVQDAQEAALTHTAAYGAQHLFWRTPPPAIGPELRRSAHVVPCATAVQEVEWMAREVKRLILDCGADAADIGVIFRDTSPLAPTIRRGFAQAGIPIRMQRRLAVSDSLAGQFLLGLLDALETWDRDAVCDALSSPWFGAALCDTATQLTWQAQIVAGRDEWSRRIERLQRAVESPGLIPAIDRIENAAEAIDALARSVGRLRAWEARLAPSGTLQQHAAALRDALAALPFGPPADVFGDRLATRERDAVATVYRVLDRVASWQLTGTTSEQMDRGGFLQRLRALLGDTFISEPTDRYGVYVGSAEAARHLRFRHVFYGGLNEGIVPARPPVDAIFSDHDIEGFGAEGIWFSEKRYRSSHEMLLFHRVADLADETLYLSYRTVGADGKELLPSPYLLDVKNLLGDALVEHRLPTAGDFAPPLAAIASARDLRNRMLLSTVIPAAPDDVPGFAEAARGAEVERGRWARGDCGRFDGALSAAVDTVAAQFDERHVLGVSALERYAECPFQFLMTTLLGIEEVRQPEADFDPRIRGIIVHRILERFHRHYLGNTMADLMAQAEDARETLAAITEEEFGAREWQSINAPEGLKRVEKTRIAAMVDRYLTTEFARITKDEKDVLGSWEPAHFEVSFGLTRYQSEDGWSTQSPFTMETPIGPVRFAGKVDRIDVADDEVRLVDYKTGAAPTAGAVREGQRFQLNVYARALEDLIQPGMRCTSAVYLPLSYGTPREALFLRGTEAGTLAEQLPEVVARHLGGLRAGAFHPTPGERCRACPRHNACRHEKARMAVKFPGAGEAADEAD